MINRIFSTLVFLGLYSIVISQTTVGLVAYYPFDEDFSDVTGNTANNGVAVANEPSINDCGPLGNALVMRGTNEALTFLGQVNNEFDTEDFTISFFFKPANRTGTQYLLSKRSEMCENLDQSIEIRYAPLNNNRGTINVVLRETVDETVSIVHTYQNDLCWQHLAVIRRGNRVLLYHNGVLVQDLGSERRIDILNEGLLHLGGADCIEIGETYDGFLDDFRIYNRALDEGEISGLYIQPDQIATADTIIFLGNAVNIELGGTCSNIFSWTPVEGVNGTNIPNPIIEPESAGTFTYTVEMVDENGFCTAKDSITIRVVDPSDLDCGNIFVPNAFTPNNDNINDLFGISNPFAIQDLIAFEIFDRWGNRVFFTEDPFEQWDGTYAGSNLNSGMLKYRISYICKGEEQLKIGNFVIIK